MKKQDFIKFYKGEKKNPFENGADRKEFLWDIERAFVVADRENALIIREAMALYNGDKLAGFRKDDGIPAEYKAYLYMRMGKTQMGEYSEAFKKLYDAYYAN